MSNKKTKGALLREIGAKASVGMLVVSACTPALELYANPTTESSSKAAVSSSELTSSSSSSTTVEVPPIESSTLPPETSESSTQPPTSETSSSSQPTSSSSQPPTSSSSSAPTTSSSTKPSTTPSSSAAPSPSTSQSKPGTSSSSTATGTSSSTSTGTSSSKAGAIADGTIAYSKNQSTSEFIDKIGKDASQVADKNGIYASVMIAQAILESASGNSTLAREPNFNLFGIKGKYEGATVGMPTLEDDGKGNMYTITAEFRKYPSYKESLGDYARLIKGAGSANPLYKGTWKSEAKTYRDATLFLTGRYATDTRYNQKLNGLIETYDLQRFDNVEKVTTKVKVTRHKVASDETLWDISKKYGVTMSRVKELNKMAADDFSLKPDSLIVVKREKYEEKATTEDKEATATKVAEAASTTSLLAQTKLKKELQLEKDTKQLALLKVRQLGSAMSNAVPSALFETKTFKIAGKQVKSDKTHYVEKDETISDISKKVGIPTNKLIAWNNLQDSILTEGQVLIIDSPLNSQI